MILDLVVTDTGDGFNSEIPSVKGCESWAHNEDEAIENAVELLRFYINLDAEKEVKVDKARAHKNKAIYKLIFTK